jgi:hypothetical protein
VRPWGFSNSFAFLINNRLAFLIKVEGYISSVHFT